MPIDDLIAANRAFLRNFRGPIPDTPARKRLAVVTCMDNRLVGTLPPALGLGTGDAIFVRVAGARIGPGDRSAIRSVAVAILFAGVREVVVVGHTDCRTAAPAERAEEAMRALGMDPDAIRSGKPIAEALGLIESPEQAVREAVDALRLSPLIPPWAEIAGAVFDLQTGEIREITRSPAMGSAPELEPAALETEAAPGGPVRQGLSVSATGAAPSAGYTPGPVQSFSASPGPVGPIGAPGALSSPTLPEIGGTPSSPLFSPEGAPERAGFGAAATSLGVTSSITSDMGAVNIGSAETAQRPAMAPQRPDVRRPPQPVGPTGKWTPPAPTKAKPGTPADRIRDMVESAAKRVPESPGSGRRPPVPPPADEEIPTAVLLDEPSPRGTDGPPPPAGSPAGPKPVFTFDKEELRRRRDEKIRRIIKGF